MFTVEQLLSPTTQPEQVEELIAFLQSSGLDVGSLGPVDFGRAFVELLAEAMASIKNDAVRATVMNFYLDYATGIALTLIGTSFFNTQRFQAVSTQGEISLTDTSGDGPHTIAVGRTFVDEVEGLTFRVVTGGTLPDSGTVTVVVECDTPGAIGNVANGTIISLQSPIAGVTVTNGISGGASWITRLGTDYEKDPVYRTRCRTMFPTLSSNSPRSAYVNLVLGAVDGSGNPVGLSKVWVDANNPGGPGTVYIYVANQTATATAQQVSDAQDYIDDNRVSPCATPTVIAATEVAVNLFGDLCVRPGFAQSALAMVTQLETEYIAGTDDDDQNIGLPLGGKQLDIIPGGAGYVLFSDLITLAKGVDGVIDFVLSSPSGNLALAGNELAVVGSVLFNVVEL